ncbi:hypothetical protein C1752_14878 [Acaryochloris thomasi RCC1774]|uniref:Uncharacterized protein n=1 Tax=Acaryochloris thomasi RCC1774 TaxID=1764569 RepID=A0A2W1JEV0_9CYAN|nr:hypothetical protein C1752_14878 [Acaryochloris thomasi RCC1774]
MILLKSLWIGTSPPIERVCSSEVLGQKNWTYRIEEIDHQLVLVQGLRVKN